MLSTPRSIVPTTHAGATADPAHRHRKPLKQANHHSAPAEHRTQITNHYEDTSASTSEYRYCCTSRSISVRLSYSKTAPLHAFLALLELIKGSLARATPSVMRPFWRVREIEFLTTPIDAQITNEDLVLKCCRQVWSLTERSQQITSTECPVTAACTNSRVR